MTIAAPGTLDFALGMAALVVAGMLMVWMVIHLRRERAGRAQLPALPPQAEAAPPPDVDMVSFGELAAELDRRRAHCDAWERRLAARIEELRAPDLENALPEVFLVEASEAERSGLVAICGLGVGANNEVIVNEVRKAGSHSVAGTIRGLRGKDEYVSYHEVVCDVAQKAGIKLPKSQPPTAEVEWSLIQSRWQAMLDAATPEERARIVKQFGDEHQKFGRKLAVVGGSMGVAKLSGFGIYLAASTLMGGATSVMGITLPFAAYTGMSSVIATMLGPVGWMALIAGALGYLGRVNYHITIPAVFGIAAVRYRLIDERDLEIKRVAAERDGKLAAAKRNLAELAVLLEWMIETGLKAVPRSSAPL